MRKNDIAKGILIALALLVTVSMIHATHKIAKNPNIFSNHLKQIEEISEDN